MVNLLFQLADACEKEMPFFGDSFHEEKLIGEIILNRIVGIAYDKMDWSRINKENRKALSVLKQEQERQYDIFLENLRFLSDCLTEVPFSFALLKGAYLTPVFYERGQRTSNDIDILISSEDLSELQKILLEFGFVQGHCDSAGKIIAASRREILEARLNFGETVPFLRYVNGHILEVDLNFSVDYKASGSRDIVRQMLQTAEEKRIADFKLRTLSDSDFLIHLCFHLFKEATTYDWLIHRRDLMLYKFSDINVFLRKRGSPAFFESLSAKIQKYDANRACYYAFATSAKIFPKLISIDGFSDFMERIKPASTEYLHQIIYPKEKKLFSYSVDFMQWFQAPNRIALLEEVK